MQLKIRSLTLSTLSTLRYTKFEFNLSIDPLSIKHKCFIEKQLR